MNKNSKNYNKPHSTDDPFQKARDKGSSEDPAGKEDDKEKSLAKKEAHKGEKKEGARKRHKGHHKSC